MMKYTNETKLTQDELVTLLSKETLSITKFCVSLGSIITLLTLLFITWDTNDNTTYVILTVLLSICLILTILMFIGKKYIIKFDNKSLKDGITYKYTFYENEFVIDTVIGEKTNHLVLQYKGLERIKVKGNYAVLYANTISMYFVNMDNFTEGKEEILKLFSLYKKKKSKR